MKKSSSLLPILLLLLLIGGIIGVVFFFMKDDDDEDEKVENSPPSGEFGLKIEIVKKESYDLATVHPIMQFYNTLTITNENDKKLIDDGVFSKFKIVYYTSSSYSDILASGEVDASTHTDYVYKFFSPFKIDTDDVSQTVGTLITSQGNVINNIHYVISYVYADDDTNTSTSFPLVDTSERKIPFNPDIDSTGKFTQLIDALQSGDADELNNVLLESLVVADLLFKTTPPSSGLQINTDNLTSDNITLSFKNDNEFTKESIILSGGGLLLLGDTYKMYRVDDIDDSWIVLKSDSHKYICFPTSSATIEERDSFSLAERDEYYLRIKNSYGIIIVPNLSDDTQCYPQDNLDNNAIFYKKDGNGTCNIAQCEYGYIPDVTKTMCEIDCSNDLNLPPTRDATAISYVLNAEGICQLDCFNDVNLPVTRDPAAVNYEVNAENTACIPDCSTAERGTGEETYHLVNGNCVLESCEVGYWKVGEECREIDCSNDDFLPIQADRDDNVNSYEINDDNTACVPNCADINFDTEVGNYILNADKTACIRDSCVDPYIPKPGHSLKCIPPTFVITPVGYRFENISVMYKNYITQASTLTRYKKSYYCGDDMWREGYYEGIDYFEGNYDLDCDFKTNNGRGDLSNLLYRSVNVPDYLSRISLKIKNSYFGFENMSTILDTDKNKLKIKFNISGTAESRISMGHTYNLYWKDYCYIILKEDGTNIYKKLGVEDSDNNKIGYFKKLKELVENETEFIIACKDSGNYWFLSMRIMYPARRFYLHWDMYEEQYYEPYPPNEVSPMYEFCWVSNMRNSLPFKMSIV